MKAAYSIGPLAPDRIEQVYPLAREIAEDLTPEDWCDYARTVIGTPAESGRPRGIVVAELDGYVRGMFTYRVEPDLGPRRILELRNFAAVQVVRRKPLADALMDAADELARMHDCGVVHAHIPAKSAWALSYFEDHGHEVETLCLCQTACG
jgi:GNAT superfamily N-acetyltransferase